MIRRLQNQLEKYVIKEIIIMFHKEKMINTGKNIFHKILNHFTEILYVIS